jgi:cyclic pyranopterin phosphate synthase
VDEYMVDGQKLFYHTKAVNDFMHNKVVFPIYMEVSPVSYCNQHCSFCAFDYVRKGKFRMHTSTLYDCVKGAAAHGLESVLFAGDGEPSLHPHLQELVKCCKELGLDVAIGTNGTGFTDARLESILPMLTWIKFSINAGSPETYALIHGTTIEHYRKAWHAVRFAASLQTEATVGVQMVLLPENMDEVELVARHAIDAGAAYLAIKPYSHNERSFTTKYKDLDYGNEFERALSRLRKYNSSSFKIIGRTNAAKALTKPIPYPICLSVPNFWCYLQESGDLWACSTKIGDPQFFLGNVNEEKFKGLWLGQKASKLRNTMKTYSTEQCRKACRMHQCNLYLNQLINPNPHWRFI